MIENERFGLVFAKSGSTNSGTVLSVLPLSPSLWFESDRQDLQTTQYRVPYTVESPLPPANFALAVGAPAHIFSEKKVLDNSVVEMIAASPLKPFFMHQRSNGNFNGSKITTTIKNCYSIH
jgi:hypothetical protein